MYDYSIVSNFYKITTGDIVMPDWSYHPLFKPIFKKLNPETGRNFIHKGMSAIAAFPGGAKFIEFLGHMETSPALAKEKWNTMYPSSIGLSGRIDPELSGTKAFCQLGFGLLELGPVSDCDSTPSLEVDWANEEMRGLKGHTVSIDRALTVIESLPEKHPPLWVHIKKDVVDQVRFEELVVKSKAIVVDIEQISMVEALNVEIPVLVDIPASSLLEAATVINQFWEKQLLSGIIVDVDEMDVDITCALSLIKGIPISIRGGVSEPEDAVNWIDLGADFILLESGYVFSGPGLPKRINERILFEKEKHSVYPRANWIYHFLFGMAITSGGILALLFALTRVILPYDELFLGASRSDILLFNSRILAFMEHDRMTLAGTMISGGIIYMQLAYHGIRKGVHWTYKTFKVGGIVGFLGILLFIGYGYFDWLHGLFWIILLPIFILAIRNSKHAVHAPTSRNKRIDPAWKMALWGQLCFVVLGFSLSIGGIVISTVGITSVFVPSDLTFICMTPDQLVEFNNQLIPLIAHDRAGFGSALLAVGLLVLMLSLWGYHQGEQWVWHTFFCGGMPAFLAGLTTHYFIGYLDFFHLLPAYFACVLYLAGLILSRGFLLKK